MGTVTHSVQTVPGIPHLSCSSAPADVRTRICCPPLPRDILKHFVIHLFTTAQWPILAPHSDSNAKFDSC